MGLYHSAFKGRGMEFEEVREYQPGDDVRYIDWNVTARLQHPYTKVFREEREITVWILLDISLSTSYGSQTSLKREYMAEVAALLTFAATKNNDQVGLILFSDYVEAIYPPKKGMHHAMRLVREAMAFPAKGHGSDLAMALFRLGRVQRRRCICFVISDFLYKPRPRLCQLMARHHDMIAIMVGDTTEKVFPLSTVTTMVDAESGKSVAYDWSLPLRAPMPLVSQWNEHSQLFLNAGAEVIQLNTERPSFYTLCKFFRLRSRRLRMT